MRSTDDFYLEQLEPNKSCFLTMRHILLDLAPKVTETIKYGMPCFCYHGTPFCYLWKDKKSDIPYFLMVEGRQIDHPLLQAGDRKRMKTLSIDPNKDMPIAVILEVMKQALTLGDKKA